MPTSNSGRPPSGVDFLHNLLNRTRMAKLIHSPAPSGALQAASMQEARPFSYRPLSKVQSSRESAAASDPDVFSMRQRENPHPASRNPANINSAVSDGVPCGFRPAQPSDPVHTQKKEQIANRATITLSDDLADSAPRPHMRFRPLPDHPPLAKSELEAREKQGIAPAQSKAQDRQSVGNLLERMRFEAMKDGSVMYFVDGSIDGRSAQPQPSHPPFPGRAPRRCR